MSSTINYLIFGPEGGFSQSELKIMEDGVKVHLTTNRLRSETAIISAAVLLANTLL
jgi:RsmE family RNA methyltransferase